MSPVVPGPPPSGLHEAAQARPSTADVARSLATPNMRGWPKYRGSPTGGPRREDGPESGANPRREDGPSGGDNREESKYEAYMLQLARPSTADAARSLATPNMRGWPKYRGSPTGGPRREDGPESGANPRREDGPSGGDNREESKYEAYMLR
uniref:Uncharacterized protein n=1 Tax=Oryza meridionalis TaxID=40149 RepID=A0A0E0FC54_9ORYZ